MKTKGFFVRILATGCFFAGSMLLPSIAHAQVDPRVAKSMESLKVMSAKLGTPKLEGKEAVGGKDAAGLYFGTTKINNNFDIVDAVGKEDGKGMTATFFAKSGNEYIRVDECAKAGRQWSSGWHCSGRASARCNQSRQGVLRRSPYSGNTVRNGLRADEG